MDRKEYENFRDSVLKERFVCVRNMALRNALMDNSHRYLFECVDRKTKKHFWVFDKTDEVVFDIRRYYNDKRASQNKTEKMEESGE